MPALDAIRESRVWNEQWGLPLFPSQNPHQYLAYTQLLLKLLGESVDMGRYNQFFRACEVRPGLFKRWPDTGDDTSHDEAIGAASMGEWYAGSILRYLDRYGGDFNVHGREDPTGTGLRFNLYRIAWLRGYLAACAGEKPSPIEQALWILKLLVGAFREHDGSKCGPKPRLQNWLMAEKMRRFPLCELAWSFYRWRIERAGCTLRGDLEQEPEGVPWGATPVISPLAPLTYDLPESA